MSDRNDKDNKDQNDKSNKKDGEKGRDNKNLGWAFAAALLGGAALVGYLYYTEEKGEWLEGRDALNPENGQIPAPRILTVTHLEHKPEYKTYILGAVKENGQAVKMTFTHPESHVETLLQQMKIGKTYEISGSARMLAMREVPAPRHHNHDFKPRR